MKRFILGLALFIGGVIGAGSVLIAVGAYRSGGSYYMVDEQRVWMFIFVVIAIAGIITSLYDLQAAKNANKINK